MDLPNFANDLGPCRVQALRSADAADGATARAAPGAGAPAGEGFKQEQGLVNVPTIGDWDTFKYLLDIISPISRVLFNWDILGHLPTPELLEQCDLNLLVLNAGNGWEWGLLGRLFIVIMDHSPIPFV